MQSINNIMSIAEKLKAQIKDDKKQAKKAAKFALKHKPTFGPILPIQKAKSAYGMVYKVTFADGTIYYGSKCFFKKSQFCLDYETYATSSKHVKAKIASGIACTWEVIELVKTCKAALLAVEYAFIKQSWRELYAKGAIDQSLNLQVGKTKRADFLKTLVNYNRFKNIFPIN